MKGLPAASLKVMLEAFFFLQYLLEFENCYCQWPSLAKCQHHAL